MTLRMIDEASYQGHGWTTAALKTARVQVVAVKATEGTTYRNPDYLWQVEQARAAGCVLIHYHVTRYGSITGEANWFLATAATRPGDLIALDHEPEYLTGIAAASVSNWAGDWTADVEKATHATAVVQYCADSTIAGGYLESVRGREPLWLAEPGANPASPLPPSKPWLISFLQYGTRPQPVTTDVDCAYFGTYAQVRQLGIPQPPAPPPGPRGKYVSGGNETLSELAAVAKQSVQYIIWCTAHAHPRGFGSLEAAYIDAGDWAAPMPKGMAVWVP